MNVLFACKFSPFLSPFSFITFCIFLVNYLAFEFCRYFHQRLLLVEFFFSAMRFFLMFINAVCGLFLTIKLFKSGKCFSSQLNFISHYKKCDFENEYIERAEKVSAIVSIRRGQGTGRAFVTGSQLPPNILLPTFACYWSSSLGKKCCYDPAFHFEFWGRPF